MRYTVQSGDTIAAVTKRLGTTWDSLKKENPGAVSKSTKNGNWFLKAGATVSAPSNSFQEILAQQTTKKSAQQPSANVTSINSSPQSTTEKNRETIHTLQQGETVWGLAVNTYHLDPADILRLNQISDPRSLQIGQQLRIPSPTQQPQTDDADVVASWYGQYHHGRVMANGSRFDMNAATIAHKKIPLGTKVELENPETGEKASAVVTDRGPYIQGRDVDLSYGLAKKLSLDQQGVGNLRMRIL